MRKQNKWTIALISVLLGVSASTTTVQAADASSDVATSQSNQTTTQTSTSYNKADYFLSNPKIVRVKHATKQLTMPLRTSKEATTCLLLVMLISQLGKS